MGQVIAFPTPDDRTWRDFEKNLRSGLLEEGLPVETIDWICQDLKPRFIACMGSLSVSVDLPAGCEQPVTKVVQELTVFFQDTHMRMLTEMAKLEADLYVAKHGMPTRF